MSRPMVLIGMSFMLTLIILGVYDSHIAGIVFLLAILMFLVTICIRKIRQAVVLPAVALTVAAACLLFYVFTKTYYEPILSLAGENISISGRISELPTKNYGKYYYKIKTETIAGNSIKTTVRLSSKYPLEAEPFDAIRLNANLYVLGEHNEESHRQYKAQGVFLGAYTSDEIVITRAEHKPISYYILKFRIFLKEQIMSRIPTESGGLLVGMLLGDKSGLSAQTLRDFKDTGVSHLLAVSGMHASIWAMTVFVLLEKLKVSRRIAAAISSVFVFAFMVLVGFSPSVVRASLMTLILFISHVLNREADSLNSLGLAGFIITFLNPFSALDIGLLLSFSATLGILLTYKPISAFFKNTVRFIKFKLLQKPLTGVLEGLAVTLSAIIFTLPVNILYLDSFSLIAPITNILIVSLSTFATLLAGIGTLISALPWLEFISNPILFCGGLISKFMLKVTDLLVNIPYVSIRSDFAFIKIWLAGTLIMAAIAILSAKRKHKLLRLTAILSVIALLAGTLSYQVANRGVTQVKVADVGNGISVVITRGRNVAVIGCGGNFFAGNTIALLVEESSARNLELLVIPRFKETESSELDTIASRFKIQNIMTPEKNEQLQIPGITNKITITDHSIAKLWNDVEIEYLNQNNLCCALVKIGETKVIVSFVPSNDFSYLPVGWTKANVLICRADLPKKIERCAFDTIVISGDKFYNYYNNQIPVISTAGYGNIIISTRGGEKLSVRRDK